MAQPAHSLDPNQLSAYFALIEVVGLLRHAVERQLREAGEPELRAVPSFWPALATPRREATG